MLIENCNSTHENLNVALIETEAPDSVIMTFESYRHR